MALPEPEILSVRPNEDQSVERRPGPEAIDETEIGPVELEERI